MISVSLCVVASGDAYMRYATQLFRSAGKFFRPTDSEVRFHLMPGPSGWPAATMYRHHVLLESFPTTHYVFLCDADMLFVDAVGPEILCDGVTATLHPGYVNQPREQLPYETNHHSSCYVPPHQGGYYYCGGFVGGRADAMEDLCTGIADLIDADAKEGRTPCWHDESALNKWLSLYPPKIALPPSYCYPQSDGWYRSFWVEQYHPRLMALDKTAEERGDR